MPVADRLLAGRLAVDRLERQRDLDQLLPVRAHAPTSAWAKLAGTPRPAPNERRSTVERLASSPLRSLRKSSYRSTAHCQSRTASPFSTASRNDLGIACPSSSLAVILCWTRY